MMDELLKMTYKIVSYTGIWESKMKRYSSGDNAAGYGMDDKSQIFNSGRRQQRLAPKRRVKQIYIR
jgi:hypothetical protein